MSSSTYEFFAKPLPKNVASCTIQIAKSSLRSTHQEVEFLSLNLFFNKSLLCINVRHREEKVTGSRLGKSSPYQQSNKYKDLKDCISEEVRQIHNLIVLPNPTITIEISKSVTQNLLRKPQLNSNIFLVDVSWICCGEIRTHDFMS